MFNGKTVTFILPAAGSGERFGAGSNKVFAELCGKSVLRWSFEEAARHPAVDEILVVCRDGEEEMILSALSAGGAWEKPVRTVRGGRRRADSVLCALTECRSDIVLIHDAARPFLKASYIDACLEAMERAPAAAIAVPSKDTVKLVYPPDAGETGGSCVPDPERGEFSVRVRETPPRALVWNVQTPQCFLRELLLEAHREYGQDEDVTDDCMLMERAGSTVLLLKGDYSNIKITTPEDLTAAGAIARGCTDAASGKGER